MKEETPKISAGRWAKMASSLSLANLCGGLPLDPLPPPQTTRDPSVPHAPPRTPALTRDEKKQALKNALRYFPPNLHSTLAPEFAEELEQYGHIYMYRFRPNFDMKAYPIQEYPCRIQQAAAMMIMVMNNLDPRVAQFPHELVTYGGNGQVLSNWAQFWLLMNYLSRLEEDQTLVMCSGHPQGLFPSQRWAPRCVISNGMVVPNYSSKEEYEKMFAMGVSMYGQMTAGSYCYIGPQGIVHGTTLTVMNAGRKYLNLRDLTGQVFLTSGLGGMSGAQPKASVIAGCVGVIAEVSRNALMKRYEQGWLMEWTDDLDACVNRIKRAKKNREVVSLGYLGNVVDLWERVVMEYQRTGELLVELGSDQTSLHNPHGGGYYPVQLGFDEAQQVMKEDPQRFKDLVNESLRRHVDAVNKLADAGMHFWDYGNAFLLEASRAGAAVSKPGMPATVFRYPSYVQDIMGDIFSLGFGPFRWVCTSGLPSDLNVTDNIALETMEELSKTASESAKRQYADNCKWITEAGKHQLVVGSQARILYSNEEGRIAIALAFNKAVTEGKLQGPVVLSRDHHDVGGTDSPFRETSNIEDGSKFCADMAVQNVIGDSCRGATWVALHNGGGVGWGEVINGGFGLLLDGSEEAADRAKMMLSWDVLNGIARRSWSGHPLAKETLCAAMAAQPKLAVTLSHQPLSDQLLDDCFN